ncbi:MAG: thiopurine S-methyltransferase [Myxococcota bacterium]
MDANYWLERWKDGRIGFHRADANPHLVAHHRVFNEAVRVLVPLCGKSVDLEWLVVHGYEVVGVELSELAAQAFFGERGFAPERREEGAFTHYRHGGVTIVVGDFFAATSQELGNFDGVYDRAAMIALPRDLRARYTQHLRTLLAPKAKLLLVTLHFDAESGPPFSVSPAEVAAAYPDAKITNLATSDASSELPNLLEAGATFVREHVYAVEFGVAPTHTARGAAS